MRSTITNGSSIDPCPLAPSSTKPPSSSENVTPFTEMVPPEACNGGAISAVTVRRANNFPYPIGAIFGLTGRAPPAPPSACHRLPHYQFDPESAAILLSRPLQLL